MKKFEYRLEELHIDIKSALNPAYTELHDQLEEKLKTCVKNSWKKQQNIIKLNKSVSQNWEKHERDTHFERLLLSKDTALLNCTIKEEI